MKSKLLATIICITAVSLTACGSKVSENVKLTTNTEIVEDTEKVVEVEETEEVEEAVSEANVSEASKVLGNTSSEVAEAEVIEETSSNTESVPAKTTNNSTPANNSGTTAKAHTHSWTPVYKTIHHDAVTHTEDQGYYEDQGYDKRVLICKTCGAEFDSLEELQAHRNVSRETYPDNPDMWHGGSINKPVHITNNVWVSNIVTVVDSPAYDEQVIDHYECSCGATK